MTQEEQNDILNMSVAFEHSMSRSEVPKQLFRLIYWRAHANGRRIRCSDFFCDEINLDERRQHNQLCGYEEISCTCYELVRGENQ